jgi:hypothetical protein
MHTPKIDQVLDEGLEVRARKAVRAGRKVLEEGTGVVIVAYTVRTSHCFFMARNVFALDEQAFVIDCVDVLL